MSQNLPVPGKYLSRTSSGFVEYVWSIHMRLRGLLHQVEVPGRKPKAVAKTKREAAHLGLYLAELREGWRVWARENPRAASEAREAVNQFCRPILAFLDQSDGKLPP